MLLISLEIENAEMKPKANLNTSNVINKHSSKLPSISVLKI